MDRESKILLVCFVMLMTVSVSALFYKSFIAESYELTYSADYSAGDSLDEMQTDNLNEVMEAVQ